ncbi:MAG: hypothetical protein R3Y43_06685 [Alphaproteobacteria bacterium]
MKQVHQEVLEGLGVHFPEVPKPAIVKTNEAKPSTKKPPTSKGHPKKNSTIKQP